MHTTMLPPSLSPLPGNSVNCDGIDLSVLTRSSPEVWAIHPFGPASPTKARLMEMIEEITKKRLIAALKKVNLEPNDALLTVYYHQCFFCLVSLWVNALHDGDIKTLYLKPTFRLALLGDLKNTAKAPLMTYRATLKAAFARILVDQQSAAKYAKPYDENVYRKICEASEHWYLGFPMLEETLSE